MTSAAENRIPEDVRELCEWLRDHAYFYHLRGHAAERVRAIRSKLESQALRIAELEGDKTFWREQTEETVKRKGVLAQRMAARNYRKSCPAEGKD